MKFRQFGCDLARDQRGATAVEYGLVASLIVIAMIGALQGVADANSSMWNDVSNKVATGR